MTPILVEGPAVEPVTVAEMRAYLRLDDGAEDALLAALIAAARVRVEALSSRLLIASRWRVILDRWPPGGVLALPLGPVLAIGSIRVTDASGASALVAPSLYALVPGGSGRLVPEPGRPDPWPLYGGVAIEWRAGYGETASAVPAPLVQAVRLLVAHAFEHRGDEDAPPPPDLPALTAPYRGARL